MSLARPLRRPPLCIRRPRNYSSTTPLRRAPIQYTPTCPPPTDACACSPPGLDIDRTSPLLNTMAAHSAHVVVCTGKDDWPSRIDDSPGAAGDFVRGVRGEIGKGGRAFDPFNNVLVTLSSLPASTAPDTSTALLFPHFLRLPALPHDAASFSALAAAYLKPRTLNPFHARLAPEQKALLTRDPSLAASLPAPQPIANPVVLICGHASRDSRCGAIGPLLRTAFQKEFARRGIEAEVALVSHVGGHKFAGNVIVYVPREAGGALGGAGVWYGRVGPEHVEGVVGETVVEGKVVAELLRGGMSGEGVDLGRALEEQARGQGEVEGWMAKVVPRRRAGSVAR